jgi:DNA-directed RNA polymerase subunit RPC12/RpoP
MDYNRGAREYKIVHTSCSSMWDKIKLAEPAPSIPVNFITILGAAAVAVLFFFGIIFAWSTGAIDDEELRMSRFIVAGMLFAVGFGIAYYISKKPTTIVQKLEVSGEMKAVALKCPNCSASVDANSIKMVSGVPYATCPYCGHTFEVAEEPKW